MLRAGWALFGIPSGLGQNQLFFPGVALMSGAFAVVAGMVEIMLHMVSRYPAGLPGLIGMMGNSAQQQESNPQWTSGD